jgi:ATP-dependent DNA helicase RecG
LTTQWLLDDVSLRELAAVLIGFANTAGGTILLGIDQETGNIHGVEDPVVTADFVFQAAIMADPPLVLPIPQVISSENKKIVKVVVPNGLPNVYNLAGRYYGRSDGRTIILADRKLRQLLMKRGVIQIESRFPPDSSLEDLNRNQISKYMMIMNRFEDDQFIEILRQRGCIKVDDGEFRPTYAGLLLFGNYPQQWLPSVSILAARFPGITFSDEFVKQEIFGPLPEQIRQCEVFVRDHLRSVVRMVGLTRQEIPEYPLEAVRELIVNAVAHRDYNQQGDNIHLHIFSDRLEVHSPGGLPGPVNLENLLEARFSRNAVIAQVLSDLGFIERLGYGLNRVVKTLQQHNLPAPIFEEVGGSFRVTIFNALNESQLGMKPRDLTRYSKLNLNNRQESAIAHLAKNGRITNRKFQELCAGVSSETLRRDLVDLVKKGILIKIGDKKSTYYILK